MQKIKDFLSNMESKTRRLLLIIISATLVVAAVAIAALTLSSDTGYSTLFTDLNQEEAQEIVGLLQEDEISYQYNNKNGTIRVPDTQVDKVRADLLSKGYPQSGFTYDMYINNAGLMTTESDKKQYTLYELQDRLGAQIRLFDGVKDAKVTIAMAEEQIYALDDSSKSDASASVVVTMKPGETLTGTRAAAVKNLIARAVRGMNFSNVAVFDAETMLEVSSEDDESSTGSGESIAALTTLVETNIANNIRRVLEKLYGEGNVAISVKGTLNMERLISENVVYSVPSQVDENDRSGLLYYENAANENSGTAAGGVGGVAGADANADVPRYTTGTGQADAVDTYANNSATREWLFNTLKEQREIEPGVLENITVGIVINTDKMDIPQMQLVSLVANAAGIPQENAERDITIIRALGDADESETEKVVEIPAEDGVLKIPLWLIITIAASALLMLLLLILLLRRRKKKRKAAEEELDLETDPFDTLPEEGASPSRPLGEAALAFEEEDSEMAKNEEIINLRMQRNLKLKQNIGEFVDQNPQVAAKLLQGWLRGEGAENGRK